MRKGILAVGLLFILCSCGSSSSDKPAGVAPSASVCPKGPTTLAAAATAESVPGRAIVKMKNGARGPGREIAPGVFVVDGASERIASDDVEYAEPDYIVRGQVVPDIVHSQGMPGDPGVAKQWAHGVVQSEAAWELSRGGESVIVAVLDSGIDASHEDLAANMWTNPGEIAGNGKDDDNDGFVDDIHGWNFAKDTANVTADDSSFHGTHVAGTIGAVCGNGKGVCGHSPLVRLMALKFLDSSGSGSTSDAIRGIDYAIAHGAKIISNSWGSFGYSKALGEAVARAEKAGVLFVAAAGNSANDNAKRAFYPASYENDNVISVASSTSADKLSSFSDYGSTVHLAAPGSSIYSTKNGNQYQYLSGTSMATPLVSGVLATMIARRPDLGYRQIKGALMASVDQLPAYRERLMWNGRINAFKALQLVSGIPGDWTPPEPPAHVCP